MTDTLLQKTLLDHLRADPGLIAVMGQPARIWDQPPPDPLFPHLLLGRSETRPYAGLHGAGGEGLEHLITLTSVSRFGGLEEAKATMAALRAALDRPRPEVAGLGLVSWRVTYADVFRSADWRSVFGIARIRALTEA